MLLTRLMLKQELTMLTKHRLRISYVLKEKTSVANAMILSTWKTGLECLRKMDSAFLLKTGKLMDGTTNVHITLELLTAVVHS